MRALQNGAITLPEAREAHALSAKELDDWRRRYQRGGLRALKAELVR